MIKVLIESSINSLTARLGKMSERYTEALDRGYSFDVKKSMRIEIRELKGKLLFLNSQIGK